MKKFLLFSLTFVLATSFQYCASSYKAYTSLIETYKKVSGKPISKLLIVGTSKYIGPKILKDVLYV